ncbi:MAG: toll/interleukin-1 receptor domain-containing protein, partial [Planctomycetes bacterium]|nr:toll/interleukin-1 receptor domain-containing protein [Planctomycetota bacterium]
MQVLRLSDTITTGGAMSPQDGSFEYDVFLSHNSADKPRVRHIAELLKAAGLSVWFDEWSIKPGEHIHDAVRRGLRASRKIVFCVS